MNGYRLLKPLCLMVFGLVFSISGFHKQSAAQPGRYFGVDWHPTDEVISISDGYTLSLYTTDFTLMERVSILDPAAAFYGQHVTWSPDGTKIAVNLSADTLNTPSGRILQVWSWDGSSLQLLFEIPDIDVAVGVAWHPDGTQFAAVPLLQEPFVGVTLYDASTGQPIVNLGHDQAGSPSQLAWSPDGTQLVFEREGGDLRIWDVSSQQVLGTLTNRFDNEIELDYSPTENLLAFVNPDNRNDIQIWNTNTFQHVQTLSGHSNLVSTFNWGTGGLVSTSFDDTTRFWDIATGQAQTVISTRSSPPSWDPSGSRWVANEGNSKIRIREAASGLVLVEFDPVTETVLFAPTANAGPDQTLTDSDATASSPTPSRAILQSNSVWQVAWHPSENVLAIAFDLTPEELSIADQSVWLYTVEGQVITQIPMPLQNNIKDVKWSPQGSYLAVVSSRNGIDSIYIIDTSNISNPQLLPDFPVGHPTSRDIAWSPDEESVAINWGGTIEIWEVASGTKVSALNARPDRSGVFALAWSSDNKLADAGTEEVYIWDMNNPTDPLVILPLGIGLVDIAWSADASQIAIGDLGHIAVWHESTIENPFSLKIATLPIENREPPEMDSSSVYVQKVVWQGDHLASLTHFGGVDIWDTTTWQSIGSLEGIVFTRALSLSPDGQQIAYASPDGSLVILTFPTANAGPDQTLTDTDANGTELVSLDGTASTDSDGSITSYEWQLDGTSIATGSSPQVELPVGEHTITLLITDDDGLVDVDDVLITIELELLYTDSDWIWEETDGIPQ